MLIKTNELSCNVKSNTCKQKTGERFTSKGSPLALSPLMAGGPRMWDPTPTRWSNSSPDDTMRGKNAKRGGKVISLYNL